VAGSKGERRYAWAWIATTRPRHYLLVRKHLLTGELAYHYCYVPEDRLVTVMTLVRVACLRWPVEEGFEFGKDYFGLDHSQVRLYTALSRHIVLAIAALAVCAVTAAQAKAAAPAAVLPITADEQPPADPGLIALTVAEVKRLFMLFTRQQRPQAYHLHWVWWRRRHQARARWFHHRALDGDVDGHEHRLPRRAQLLRHDRADIRSVRLITTAMPALTRSSLRRGGSGCVDSVGEGG
jgi:hypothetical protein